MCLCLYVVYESVYVLTHRSNDTLLLGWILCQWVSFDAGSSHATLHNQAGKCIYIYVVFCLCSRQISRLWNRLSLIECGCNTRIALHRMVWVYVPRNFTSCQKNSLLDLLCVYVCVILFCVLTLARSLALIQGTLNRCNKAFWSGFTVIQFYWLLLRREFQLAVRDDGCLSASHRRRWGDCHVCICCWMRFLLGEMRKCCLACRNNTWSSPVASHSETTINNSKSGRCQQPQQTHIVWCNIWSWFWVLFVVFL